MTSAERIRAVAKVGFTERQAHFLVTVMLHAGVCLGRHYCAHAQIARGQNVYDFFSSLVARRFARAYITAHNHTNIYHLYGKRLYRTIGEPDNRNRRAVTLARSIERLMLLDAILSSPETRWLGSEREKVDYFANLTSLKADDLPHLAFGAGRDRTLRHFPDKLPIGVAADGRTHVFLYGVTRDTPVDFRAFLHRHAELLRALYTWEIRLLVPRHLTHVAPLFERAAREELSSPLRLDTSTDLRWYFQQRQRVESGSQPEDAERFRLLKKAFGAQRFWALYRTWQRQGEAPVLGTVSPVLRDAVARETGQVTSHVLSHNYLYLTPLVGSA